MYSINKLTSINDGYRNIIRCSIDISDVDCFIKVNNNIFKCLPNDNQTTASLFISQNDRTRLSLTLQDKVQAVICDEPNHAASITVSYKTKDGKNVTDVEFIKEFLLYTVVNPGFRAQFKSGLITCNVDEPCVIDEYTTIELSSNKNVIVNHIDFTSVGVGGLQNQLLELTKRVFASRMMSQSVRSKLGIKHIFSLRKL